MKGCSFSPRCRYADGRCQSEKPRLERAQTSAHQYACFHPIRLAAGAGA
jgi:peptide/nickel transport system ATP-binding protein